MNIVNFSSPHSFTLDNGVVIPACDPDMSRELSLLAVETETPHPTLEGVTDVRLSFKMTDAVYYRLKELNADTSVDVILVPLPVMTALKEANLPIGKARVCRVADRVSKIIHCDKFCI